VLPPHPRRPRPLPPPSRDITKRLERVLSNAGLRVATLKADTVSPERREDWVRRQVRDGVDVLLTHPRLVQTGLDLVEFATRSLPRFPGHLN
jgi:hypothetical protein